MERGLVRGPGKELMQGPGVQEEGRGRRIRWGPGNELRLRKGDRSRSGKCRSPIGWGTQNGEQGLSEEHWSSEKGAGGSEGISPGLARPILRKFLDHRRGGISCLSSRVERRSSCSSESTGAGSVGAQRPHWSLAHRKPPLSPDPAADCPGQRQGSHTDLAGPASLSRVSEH